MLSEAAARDNPDVRAKIVPGREPGRTDPPQAQNRATPAYSRMVAIREA